MASLQDKVVLITGAGTGIGRATALLAAKQGAKVVIGNRNVAAGEETVALIQQAGGDATFLRTDVTKEADIAALHAHAISHFGALHGAFNNAGIEGETSPLADHPEADFDLIMNVNVKGVWRSMAHQIPLMLKNGGGSIVNVSSIAGLIGFPSHAIYAASKHAVLGLTKSAALEYGSQGIRTNAVSPGAIETPMLERFVGEDDAGQEMRRQMVAMHPIGRLGKSEEIATAVVWLLSDESSFVLGQSLTVDGGFTAI